MVSLASLNAAKAAETPYRLELLDGDGAKTGVILLVLGDESETVRKAREKLLDDRRRKDAFAEAKRQKAGRAADPTFTAVAEDIEFAQALTLARLVGWEGIDEEFTTENAKTLVASSQDIANQIAAASQNLANFTKASPKA